MALMIEVEENGTLAIPAALLNNAQPHTRYILEVQENAIIVRPDKSTAPKATTLQDMDNLAERIGQAWQSEKSAVEILSEMRR